MSIHIYTRFSDDAATLGDVLAWYGRWADRVVAFDEGSSDGSSQIAAAAAGVEVRPWQGERQAFFDEVWKESRGQADWVAIVEADEILWADDPAAWLARCRQRGVSLVVPFGFEMVASDKASDKAEQGSRLWERVRHGAYSVERSRPAVFDPNAIESMDYGDEGQSAIPQGRVQLDVSGHMKLLRYRFIGGGHAMRKSDAARVDVAKRYQQLKESAIPVIGDAPVEARSTEPGRDSYDEFPYRTFARPSSRIEWLHTLGQQFGLRTAPPHACRVLEIGCGNGGNILAQAAVYPQSRFFGFDLSARHIEQANHCRQETGLDNIEFLQASLVDYAPAGNFDYIICHGVYSWIDAAIQQALLALVRRLLAPAGVAFLSYNIFPGWNFRQAMRAAMLFGARHRSTPLEQVRAAKHLVRQIIEVGSSGQPPEPYAVVLRNLMQRMSPEESYAYHEYLEEYNQPVFFEEFARAIRSHGLQYVTEAQADGRRPESRLSRSLLSWLDTVARDGVERQQYIDFLLNRGFRESLLCRDEVRLEPEACEQAIRNSWLNAREAPADARHIDGRTRIGGDPLWRTVCETLPQQEWNYMHFDEMAQRVQAPAVGISHVLRQAYHHGLVRVLSSPPPWSTVVSACPRTTAWIRWQARNDTLVTNLSHQALNLDTATLSVVALLDGTRTVEELAAATGKTPEVMAQALPLLAQARLLLPG